VGFRLFSVIVAAGMATVYGDLTRQKLRTEKELNTVFEKRGGHRSEAARRYLVAARLVESSDNETLAALEWLNKFLNDEARKEDALPRTYKSAREYQPP
jgi:hypothetical protein